MTIGLATGPEVNASIFTPRNEKEVDYIWMKYGIRNPIWTDFVPANETTFYRIVQICSHEIHTSHVI